MYRLWHNNNAGDSSLQVSAPSNRAKQQPSSQQVNIQPNERDESRQMKSTEMRKEKN